MSSLEMITADEAAAALGVTKATLYAYVSRGLLDSSPSGRGKGRLYHKDQVEELSRRKTGTNERSDASSGTELATNISSISRDGLFYRNTSAVELSQRATVEEIGELLTQRNLLNAEAQNAAIAALTCKQALRAIVESTTTRPRDKLIQILVNLISAEDAFHGSSTSRTCADAGAFIYLAVLSIASDAPVREEPLHVALATALGVHQSEHIDLIRRAMVLCSEHEFSLSSVVSRHISAADSSIYHAFLGSIAAFSGHKHGGRLDRLRIWLAPIGSLPEVEFQAAINERFRAGDIPPGYTHPASGDKLSDQFIDFRARELTRILSSKFGDQPEIERMLHINEKMEVLESHPSLDVPLVYISRVLGVHSHLYEILFLFARLIGWTAHFLEQQADESPLRPVTYLS